MRWPPLRRDRRAGRLICGSGGGGGGGAALLPAAAARVRPWAARRAADSAALPRRVPFVGAARLASLGSTNRNTCLPLSVVAMTTPGVAREIPAAQRV